MSREQVIRASLAAYNEGGIDAMLQHAAEDVVWHAPPEWPGGQEWHGRAALARSWHEQWDSVFEEVHNDLEAIEFGPERYLATLRGHGRAHGSGIELDWEVYFVGRLEGDLMKEIWVFNDREPARETAGLDPQ